MMIRKLTPIQGVALNNCFSINVACFDLATEVLKIAVPKTHNESIFDIVRLN